METRRYQRNKGKVSQSAGEVLESYLGEVMLELLSSSWAERKAGEAAHAETPPGSF